MRSMVRQAGASDWRVDRLVFGIIWLPFGRWIHQDWWCPYQFASADEAQEFQRGLS